MKYTLNIKNYLKAMRSKVLWMIVTGGILSCNKNIPAPVSALTSYEIKYPSYFPVLNVPADNPLTYEGVALGRKLYYDPILSDNGRACADCHNQQESFSKYSANSLAHINLGWNTKFLWKGGVEGTLEDAMLFEVNDFFATDISKLNQNQEYRSLFKKVYQTESITDVMVAKALAQFIRSLSSVNSKFDQYLSHATMLSLSELNGFNIFNSEKGECFHCHSPGLFHDNSFHNIGLDSVFDGANSGRYDVTINPNDIGKFKTPTLRNIALTAPYMHDGRFKTLEEVVEHYNSGVKKSATLDAIMFKPSFENGLQLSAQQKSDLIAFLKTLTDSTFVNNPAHAKP